MGLGDYPVGFGGWDQGGLAWQLFRGFWGGDLGATLGVWKHEK